jgi:hypothetical protein
VIVLFIKCVLYLFIMVEWEGEEAHKKRRRRRILAWGICS